MTALLKRYLCALLEQKTLIIALLIVYIIGIISGMVLCRKLEKVFIGENVVEFYLCVMKARGSVFYRLFIRLFTFIGLFSLFFLCGFSIWLSPLWFIMVLYRGYVLGGCFILLIVNFGVFGFFFALLVVLVTNFIVTFSLIIYAALLFKLKSNAACSQAARNKKLIEITVFSLAVAAIAALYEFVVVAFVIKPITLYF